jgi:hypothetical protein
VLKLLGMIGLVALILVGALMPLKYTSRMHLPRARPPGAGRESSGESPGDDSSRAG